MRWKFETGDDTEIYNQIGIASSAAVAGGVVYFGCRDGHFYAVDAKTGVEKWKEDNHRGWVIASPAIQNGVVYFPTSEGTRFKALDAATGRMMFNIENKAISFSSPAIAKGIAYFGSSDGWLHAVDLKSGRTQSEFQTEGSKQNSVEISRRRRENELRRTLPGYHAGRRNHRHGSNVFARIGSLFSCSRRMAWCILAAPTAISTRSCRT